MSIMKRSILGLTVTVQAAGLVLIGLSFPMPARASIPCEAGTVSNSSNGSLVSCVLRTDVNAGLSNNVYPCKKGHEISFDEQGRFSSCVLSAPLKVRRGNEVVTCLADSWVHVSISSKDGQSVSCGSTASTNHW